MSLRLGIVGATGAVGQECLRILAQGLGPPVEHVVPIATPMSAGRDLGKELDIELPMELVTTLECVDFSGLDSVVFCAGAETSRREGERVAAGGPLVVDNSSAFRMRDDVPLVVPQVNGAMLVERPATGIVANPNCSTIQLVRALHPLHLLAGLERVVVSTYQAASGGGLRGLAELAACSERVLAGVSAQPEPPGKFGQPLAFNLVPQIGDLDGAGRSHEERKLAREPRKILGIPELAVAATAVRVPVVNGHSEAAYVSLRRAVTQGEVETALAAAPGVRLYRSADDPPFPMPRLTTGGTADRTLVHVGRVRVDPDDARAVWLWIVADNLWVGAALNALDIIDHAVRAGWLGR